MVGVTGVPCPSIVGDNAVVRNAGGLLFIVRRFALDDFLGYKIEEMAAADGKNEVRVGLTCAGGDVGDAADAAEGERVLAWWPRSFPNSASYSTHRPIAEFAFSFS